MGTRKFQGKDIIITLCGCLIGTLLLCGCQSTMQPSAGAARKMALVVMLDGQRGDSINNLYMPNIDMLRKGQWQPGYNCAWSDSTMTVPDARPSSAANHAALSTGVVASKNNVFTNQSFSVGKYTEWPIWLARLKAAKPETKALFAFSWKSNEAMNPTPSVEFIFDSDENNAKTIAERLAATDAPEATMLFIDAPDHGGHTTGFYPYGSMYRRLSYRSDETIGNILSAIQNRATFKDEDWMIAIVGDHGGYAGTHGIWGGHATTVPLIIVGKDVKHGRIPGLPNNMDTAATVLEHFGIYSETLQLDGIPRGKTIETPKGRALTDRLEAYFTFDEKQPINHVENSSINAKLFGEKTAVIDKGFAEGCLHVESIKEGTRNIPAGTLLEGSDKLQYENGSCMTVTCWVRLPATPQIGDPLIVGNKNWQSGRHPGCAFIAAKATEGVDAPGICLNYARSGKVPRCDIGTFDIEHDDWTFYAFTFAQDGSAHVYQGRKDGYLYSVAEHAEDAIVKSEMPWHIGQDGTGKYESTLLGDIDEFAFWTRALNTDEIRCIYESGRKGVTLEELISK